MSDDTETFVFEGTDYSPEEIARAIANYENQVNLVNAIQETFRESKMTAGEGAEQIGIPATDFEELLSGSSDMTLTELRLLANTVGVTISYSITA